MKWYLNKNLFIGLAFLIVLLKLVTFGYLQIFQDGLLFGGGNDAGYYHAYAEGYTNIAVNFWPVMLRFFNDIGLYSRELWSVFLLMISITLLPWLFYKTVTDPQYQIEPVKSASIFLIIFYPTIFFFSLDVYRDIVMYSVFLLAILAYKKYLNAGLVNNWIFLLLFFGLSYFLFLMRPYLGAALVLTVFTYFAFSKTSRYVKTWVFVYLLFLLAAKSSGLLNEILEYRGEDGFSDGGSSLGIGLLNANPVMFFIYFVYSFLAQVFGLFLVNANALMVFLFESIPFILALGYVLRNIQYATKFVHFLLVFFVIYTSVWVLGNDNLGTAVRLRIPGYLSIFVCMFIIYQEKAKYMYFQTLENAK